MMSQSQIGGVVTAAALSLPFGVCYADEVADEISEQKSVEPTSQGELKTAKSRTALWNSVLGRCLDSLTEFEPFDETDLIWVSKTKVDYTSQDTEQFWGDLTRKYAVFRYGVSASKTSPNGLKRACEGRTVSYVKVAPEAAHLPKDLMYLNWWTETGLAELSTLLPAEDVEDGNFRHLSRTSFGSAQGCPISLQFDILKSRVGLEFRFSMLEEDDVACTLSERTVVEQEGALQ